MSFTIVARFALLSILTECCVQLKFLHIRIIIITFDTCNYFHCVEEKHYQLPMIDNSAELR